MPATEEAIELAQLVAAAADDKKATDVRVFDVADKLEITDIFLVCSAASERQVDSVVDAIHERLLAASAKPVRTEGRKESRWVLLDYADVVVHVQHDEEREFYSLERLWLDCPEIELPEPVSAGPSASGAGA